MSNYEQMSPQQQDYMLVSAASKTLYQAKSISMDLKNTALSPDIDPLIIAQRANELEHIVERGAKQLYAIKLKIEEQHPEFKAQAMEYAKTQKQQKALKTEQSF